MNRHWCPCGFTCETVGGLRRHRKKCAKADEKARREEDLDRVVQVKDAAWVNDRAKLDQEE